MCFTNIERRMQKIYAWMEKLSTRFEATIPSRSFRMDMMMVARSRCPDAPISVGKFLSPKSGALAAATRCGFSFFGGFSRDISMRASRRRSSSPRPASEQKAM